MKKRYIIVVTMDNKPTRIYKYHTLERALIAFRSLSEAYGLKHVTIDEVD